MKGPVVMAAAGLAVGAIALMIAAVSGCGAQPEVNIQIGGKMPDFTLPGVDGAEYTLSEALEKGPVVVNFSSQECPYSLKADPHLSKLYDEYRAKNVTFLSIDSHRSTTPEEIREYATEKGLSFPVLKDHGNVYADKVGATRTPEIFLVSHDGSLVYHGGPNNQRDPNDEAFEDYLKTALDELLGGREISTPKTSTWGCTIKRAS